MYFPTFMLLKKEMPYINTQICTRKLSDQSVVDPTSTLSSFPDQIIILTSTTRDCAHLFHSTSVNSRIQLAFMKFLSSVNSDRLSGLAYGQRLFSHYIHKTSLLCAFSCIMSYDLQQKGFSSHCIHKVSSCVNSVMDYEM